MKGREIEGREKDDVKEIEGMVEKVCVSERRGQTNMTRGKKEKRKERRKGIKEKEEED